jgi:hypothetical protein
MSGILLNILSAKVIEFHSDHGTYPNAILLSIQDIEILGGIDQEIIKQKLPTIRSLIPSDLSFFDTPMPVLLPVVATKLQRERAIFLESKDF